MTIPGGVPPQLLSDWKSAEERLYPVVMVRPDLYERSVRMVRVVRRRAGRLPRPARRWSNAWGGGGRDRPPGGHRSGPRPRGARCRPDRRRRLLDAVPGTGRRRLPNRAPGPDPGRRRGRRALGAGRGDRLQGDRRDGAVDLGGDARALRRRAAPDAGGRPDDRALPATASRWCRSTRPPATGYPCPPTWWRSRSRSPTRPSGWRQWRRSGRRSRASNGCLTAILHGSFVWLTAVSESS